MNPDQLRNPTLSSMGYYLLPAKWLRIVTTDCVTSLPYEYLVLRPPGGADACNDGHISTIVEIGDNSKVPRTFTV